MEDEHNLVVKWFSVIEKGGQVCYEFFCHGGKEKGISLLLPPCVCEWSSSHLFGFRH